MGNVVKVAQVEVDRPAAASIVESSHDAIVGMTVSGAVSSWNPAAARLYGFTAEEIIGRPAGQLIPLQHRAAEQAILGRIRAGEEIEAYRTQRVCRDGTTVSVSVSISPILDSVGAVVGAATTSRRISQPADASGRFDQRGGQQHEDACNAAANLKEQLDTERRLAQDVRERQDVADQRRDRMDVERAQAQSDKDRLEGQLQQSQRLEVLGQLAGGVAHDFNNLLAVILNYAAFVAEELAAGTKADLAGASHDVGQIQRAAERAAALTHQLLAFARREVVQPRVLDINTVVTDVQQLLRRTLGEDVVLRTTLAADLWPVLADPGQMEQVLVNLAVNARDAMSGGGTLSIDTANIIVGADFIAVGSPVRLGRHVRLRVGDTGTGMPPDVAKHVFEPFYTTKPDGTGTGLGLSTVYGIVNQAGATISIQSQPGVGTTFTIMIPVTDAVPVPVPVDGTPSYRRTPQGETVLVVEDEQALREVTERIFTRSGYHVLTAANGLDAIAIAADHDGDIHLLVTDVVMPNMLGREVAGKIRQIRPGIAVLYMSGYAQPVLASQGRLDPNVNLIDKPFSASALIEKAGQILNGQFQGFQNAATGDTRPSPEPTPSDSIDLPLSEARHPTGAAG